jgi:hypothetical protein
MSVVLPAPLAPMSPTTSPGAMRRSTPPTATTSPNRRTTRRASASGALMPLPLARFPRAPG